jgi:hypothetical protein
MGHLVTTAELTLQLAARHRVIVLGGLAVIAHGHPRPTFDADAWLDPGLSPKAWAEAVRELMTANISLRALTIGNWKVIVGEELADVISRDGVVRIMGANQPLDIFRDPNELDMKEFDAVWERATPLGDGTRVPDVIDLLVTKQATGRDKDQQDIAFLEAKAEREYLERLPGASPEDAENMLDRFLTPRIAEAALDHSDEQIRALGRRFLRELSDDGDPFARDILQKRS